MKTTELLRGTESEVRNEMDNRRSQGFDGTVGQDLQTGEWILTGTPAAWYEQPGNSPDEGELY
jgi:hypothetical protein